MAHWRAKLTVFIALLVLAGALAWHVLSPHRALTGSDSRSDWSALPGANTENAQHSRSAPHRADAPQVDIGTPLPSPIEGPDSNPDGPWLLSGRVEFAAYHELDLNLLLTPDSRDVYIEWLDFSDPDSTPQNVRAMVKPDGSFSEKVERYLVSPAACGWAVRLGGTYHEYILKEAAESSPRPSRADVAGLVQPRVQGRQIEFGVIRIDLAASASGVLVTGRLVHATGPACSTLEECVLRAQDGDSGRCWTEFRAGADGRFAAFALGAPRIAYLEGCTWSLQTVEDDEPIQVPAPVLRQGHADFGDIKVEGALLDIKIAAKSAPPLPDTPDPALWRWRGGDIPSVMFQMDRQSREVAVLALPPRPASLVVPEGRYKYSARIDRQDYHAEPLEGIVAARAGQRTELSLNFEPLAVVPLRVLDPQDIPTTADVFWRMVPPADAQEKQNLGGRGTDLKCVPVRAGWVTSVEASSETYEAVQEDVAAGSSELVLRFKERRNDPVLQVVMPLVPPSSDKEMWHVYLAVEYLQTPEMKEREEEPRTKDLIGVWMLSDRRVTHTFERQPPGAARLWLTDDWTAGYPDGRMTKPIDVVLPQSGTLRVELPEVGPAPWGTVNRPIIAQVLCDGRPVMQEGMFRFRDGGVRQYSYTHDEHVSAYVANSMWFGPPPDHTPLAKALVAKPHDIPLDLRPPQPGRDGELRLDLPPRLRVSLTVGGRLAEQMTVQLTSYDQRGYDCKCESTTGRAALWSMPGKAGFRITLPDRGEIHNREVTIKEGECLEFDLVVDDFRVEFTRPVDAKTPEAAIWTLHYADTGVSAAPGKTVGWGKCAYLRAGKFVARSNVPHREEVRLEFEVTRDCQIELPEVAPFPTASLLLRIKESDWRDFFKTEFEYFTTEGRPRPMSAEFEPYDEPLDLTARTTADGLRLEGLPLGKRVVVRGWCWTSEGEVLLVPVALTVETENTEDAKWTRSVRLGDGWSDLKLAVTTDLPGRMLPFDRLFDVRPGKHELAVFLDGKEAFRHTVTVPDKSEAFEVPADLLRKIEEARERAKPPDE